MVKKIFTPAYLEANEDLAIFYSPLRQKELIASLGSNRNHKKYQIVCELDRNVC